jgi:hypothetical protein
LAAVCLCVLLFGKVDGVEFSPDGFERRAYDFHRVPLLNWQVRPTSRTSITGDVERYVRSQGWIPAPGKSRRWDAVSLTSVTGTRAGEASILCHYFDLRDGNGSLVWLTWSNDHPELAASLWSAVHRLALVEAYPLVPEIFELAAQAESKEAFQERLEGLLVRSMVALADDSFQIGRYTQAARLYRSALVLDPNNAHIRSRLAALDGRAEG